MKDLTALTYDETLPLPARTRQQAAIDVVVANRRLLEVFNAMMRERWLPIALRTLVVHDLPLLRRSLEGGRSKEGESLRRLRDLASAAAGYGKKVYRSETISLVRALEYELGSRRMAA